LGRLEILRQAQDRVCGDEEVVVVEVRIVLIKALTIVGVFLY